MADWRTVAGSAGVETATPQGASGLFFAARADAPRQEWLPRDEADSPGLKTTARGASGRSGGYAVAVLTVARDGRYFVKGPSPALPGRSEIIVRVNEEVPLFRGDSASIGKASPSGPGVAIDAGLLLPGDTVSVALGAPEGPWEAAWDWRLEREETWFSSGHPHPGEVPLGERRKLAELDYFTGGWPKFVGFRSDFIAGLGYEVFKNSNLQSLGAAPEMFDNAIVSSIANLPMMMRYAGEHPEKLLFCHFLFREIKKAAFSYIRYFSPAHWLYYPASTLTDDLAADGVRAKVADPDRFRVRRLKADEAGEFIQWDGTRIRIDKDARGKGNDVVALIPVDPASGARLWREAEFAVVLAIEGDALLLDRAVLKTTARAFARGAVVAPLAIEAPDGYNGDDSRLELNYAIDAPLDERGRNAGDAMVEMFADFFKPGGELESIHGIMSDVFRWSLVRRNSDRDGARLYDTNFDGVGDDGLGRHGIDVYSLGVFDFARKLNLAMGPERIWTLDASMPMFARLTEFAGGIEFEGVSWHRDRLFRQWTNHLNIFPFWKCRVRHSHPYFFITPKLHEGAWEERYGIRVPDVQLKRLAWATMAINEIAAAAEGYNLPTAERRTRKKAFLIADEYTRGRDNMPQWLGQPVTPVLRPAIQSPDLLRGAGQTMADSFVATWEGQEGAVVEKIASGRGGAALRVTGPNAARGPMWEEMTVRVSGLRAPKGDLFIRCEVKMDPAVGFPPSVHRFLSLQLEGKNVFKPEHRLGLSRAVGDSAGFTEATFYFRNAGPDTVDAVLTFEGHQGVEIRNFTIHNAADALARGFEGGAVLANPADAPYTFDLDELFPGRAFRRIPGSDWDETRVNDGSPVEGKLTLDALSGLFLVNRE